MCAYSIHNHAHICPPAAPPWLPWPMNPYSAPLPSHANTLTPLIVSFWGLLSVRSVASCENAGYFGYFSLPLSLSRSLCLSLFRSLAVSLPISLWLNDFFGLCFYFLHSFFPASLSPHAFLLPRIDACWGWQYFFNSFCRFPQRFISFWFYYLDFCHSFLSLSVCVSLSLSLPPSFSLSISVCCTFFMSLKRLPHATVVADINENISCGAACQKNFFPYAYCIWRFGCNELPKCAACDGQRDRKRERERDRPLGKLHILCLCSVHVFFIHKYKAYIFFTWYFC